MWHVKPFFIFFETSEKLSQAAEGFKKNDLNSFFGDDTRLYELTLNMFTNIYL